MGIGSKVANTRFHQTYCQAAAGCNTYLVGKMHLAPIVSSLAFNIGPIVI